jgi:hypothetical protein
MEINILYSKDNADHLRTADLVRQAVRKLGITATIIERNTTHESPRVVVDGFNVLSSEQQESSSLSFDMIRNALEQTAWSQI